MITLEAQTRTKADDLKSFRDKGFIPAVFYGRIEPSTSIAIKEVDFIKAWKEAGESSVIKLKADGKEHDALIHEVDLDPVSGRVRHADFYIIEKGKKVSVRVPLEFVGTAPALKELGGTLVKVLHDLEIEAEAANLPHEIMVDVSTLVDFEARVCVKDIALPQGVEAVDDKDEIVALVAEAKEEVEEESAPVDLSKIELSEKKGKKEEDSEGEATA